MVKENKCESKWTVKELSLVYSAIEIVHYNKLFDNH